MTRLRLLAPSLLAAALLLTGRSLRATTTVPIDLTQVHKTGVERVGLNICWLLDSDRLRPAGTSTSDALAALHPGVLRFPYGHLADNYLWHTPSGEVPNGPLHPKVASLKQPPGEWSWAVKPDGSMPDAMDFDEFLRVCGKVGAKPVVCVNALSYRYPGGPSYEALKASAVAWVKYAAQQQVRVAYWEIGNEVDLKENATHVSFDEYVQLYADFARAMKAADPGARIGPGISHKPSYYQALIEKCPDLVDFAVVHQYEWSQKACATYAGWRDDTGNYIPNLEHAAKALAVKGRPPVKLLVTETGVYGGPALGETYNTYKALWLGELLLNQLAEPTVENPVFWGTHTPWSFQGFDQEPKRDLSVALTLRDNARTPMGDVIKLINDAALDTLLEVPRVTGRLRCYAMRSTSGDAITVILMNKDDQPTDTALALEHANGVGVRACQEFAGRNPEDRNPVVRSRSLPTQRDGQWHVTLAPLSLTAIQFTSKSPAR